MSNTRSTAPRRAPRSRAARRDRTRRPRRGAAAPSHARVGAGARSRPTRPRSSRAQEVTRVPELVPLRHERMLVSPFTFYRGAAVIMAADLGSQPDSGLRVQACGDAHLANFGGFASPERALLFDINDFDETSPGPFEWDVKRLVASFEIAARSRSFTEKETRAVVDRRSSSRTARRWRRSRR